MNREAMHYGINSKENRKGFKITGCKCRNNETKES